MTKRTEYQIGTVYGAQIRVDATWAVVFVFLSWNLSVAFGDWHPDWPAAACAALALVGVALFFGSILAHELAHAALSASLGQRVRVVHFFLLGGVSDVERAPRSPSDELTTAVFGPIVNLGLGALCCELVAARFDQFNHTDARRLLAELGPVGTLLCWLGPINLLMGAFNLLPGLPLDGGRVLRAALWKLTGSYQGATALASASGQALGWLLALWGLGTFLGAPLPLIGAARLAGVWMALVGISLAQGARRTAYEPAPS